MSLLFQSKQTLKGVIQREDTSTLGKPIGDQNPNVIRILLCFSRGDDCPRRSCRVGEDDDLK